MDDILASDTSRSFSGNGSPLTILLAALGFGMFSVTYCYNIAVPVIEAYSGGSRDSEGEE